MDRDRIEGIRHRSRRRYEMGFAESDIDFLLKCFDELEAELKLEKHQHIGTTSACQTNGKLCDQWKADCEQLQSRIEVLEAQLKREREVYHNQRDTMAEYESRIKALGGSDE